MYLESSEQPSRVGGGAPVAVGQAVVLTNNSSGRGSSSGSVSSSYHYQPVHPHFANHYAAYHNYSPMSGEMMPFNGNGKSSQSMVEPSAASTLTKSVSSVAAFTGESSIVS